MSWFVMSRDTGAKHQIASCHMQAGLWLHQRIRALCEIWISFKNRHPGNFFYFRVFIITSFYFIYTKEVHYRVVLFYWYFFKAGVAFLWRTDLTRKLSLDYELTTGSQSTLGKLRRHDKKALNAALGSWLLLNLLVFCFVLFYFVLWSNPLFFLCIRCDKGWSLKRNWERSTEWTCTGTLCNVLLTFFFFLCPHLVSLYFLLQAKMSR